MKASFDIFHGFFFLAVAIVFEGKLFCVMDSVIFFNQSTAFLYVFQLLFRLSLLVM